VMGDLVEAYTQTEKTIEATANAVSKTVDAASAAIKAPVVQAMLGLAGGNLLIAWNERQRERIKRRTAELLQEEGVEQAGVLSPSLAIPLISAAENETRPELEEMWARLLATGMNPDRAAEVRIDFIDTLRQLDPLDAQLLRAIAGHDGGPNLESMRRLYQTTLPGVDNDDLAISGQKLQRLGCLSLSHGVYSAAITSYGRKLIAACSKAN
jgi:hypothetical protein